MSAQPLIETLEKILLLHQSLTQLAQQKTEKIKTGDTDALNELLKEEKKHIQVIQKFEAERIQASKIFLSKCNEDFANSVQNPTISDCLQYADSSEQQKLTKIKAELQTQINALSDRNKLNQQLLQQSLQFVNLSLDLLTPDIDAYNYGRPGQAEQYEEGRSIFNSKA
ncbi:MAG TPA: flagellar protein FlgN [Bacillus bacterium]|nr:flagellar protein FlgN [Bacillus sp. (in: firmicutes)]